MSIREFRGLRESILLISVFLTGCATPAKNHHTSDFCVLKSQVTSLESQVKSKDSEITNLTNALKRENQKKEDLLKIIARLKNDSAKTAQKQRRKAGNKVYHSYVISIQIALRKAGFDPGLIDGRMGSRTHTALMGFQRAHNLSIHGYIDKQTWVLLRKYLD